jgi:hypothetical protein
MNSTFEAMARGVAADSALRLLAMCGIRAGGLPAAAARARE